MIDFDEGREERLHGILRTGGAAAGGITVRDYFAAEAMAATIANPADEKRSYASYAERAYKMADAMMAERQKIHEDIAAKMSVEEAFGL